MDEYRELNAYEWGFKDESAYSAIETAVLSYKVLYGYMRRQGYTEWPHPAKIPYLALGTDTCHSKHATNLPSPIQMVTPWSVTTPDVTQTTAPPKNLCAPWTLPYAWCISKQNPFQDPFELSEDGLSVTFLNGTVLTPINSGECSTKCDVTPEGTAYIGSMSKGMAV